MADTGTPQGQEPETQTEATAPNPAEAAKDPFAGLPEEFAWLKNDLETTRREAAARRVELRGLQDKFKDAKTPEEVSAAIADATKRSAQLEAEVARERAARKHKLDDVLLEFLTGTDEEQIEAQAAKLAALRPSAPEATATRQEPRGGVTPSASTPPEIDGREAWKQYRGRR
jgi:predicted  nucleic acid-binding Zn-ribbon protein